MRPKFENAPGIKMNRRKKDGVWVVFWQCRTGLAKRGFEPYVVPLWRGFEPTDADRAMISDSCNRLQSEMLVWGRGGLPKTGPFDGTVASLIYCYETDKDSPFRKNRFETREHYGRLLGRIKRDHGEERIEEIRPRDILRWHEEWSSSGVPMAHSLIGMFRGIISFGMTMLECEHCERLSPKLSKLRFKMGQPRGERLTSEQADLIRAEAHKRGLHSLALAQAIQFECMLRQRDVIGEWVPIREPGISEVENAGDKWLRGIRWSEIDSNLVLKHVTSKRQKLVEHDLSVAGMVVEEFARIGTLPSAGPVIVCEVTSRPWRGDHFRAQWRKIARAVGIPDSVRSMDSRAGGITEATEAGAELEHIKHAAAHSDIAMTQKYARAAAEKTRDVAVKRAEYRKNKSGT